MTFDRCAAVSFHAVIRYVERVLGEPCDDWLKDAGPILEEARARLCCQRAGLPFLAVIDLILCPPVLSACLAGFAEVSVRFEGFVYIVRSGRVISVLTEEMHDRRTGRLGRVREQSRQSMRRDILRNERRLKGRNRTLNRRGAGME